MTDGGVKGIVQTGGAGGHGGESRPTASRPAILVATRPEALTVVGGLPLAVRGVLALQAAGFAPVEVVAGSHAREIDAWLARRGLCRASSPESRPLGSTLVMSGDVLFDGGALAPLLRGAEPDRLRSARAAGSPEGEVHAALCPASVVPALRAALDGPPRPLGVALRTLGVPEGPPILLSGLFLPLGGRHSPAALTASLLAELGRRAAATDGYLATLLDRPLSRWITQRILGWPVTPNQVTLASILLGLGGAVGLAGGSYAWQVAGVLALLASSVLDGVDGEIARARFEQSATGARLDLLGDYVVNLGAFVGLAVGLARRGLSRVDVGAAVVLLAGVAVAIIVMHALVNRPALAHGNDLHARDDGGGLRGTPVATVVEKLAGRDYLYPLLLLVLLGRLHWFAYGAAAGAWIFVASLLAHWAHRRAASARASPPIA